MPDPGYGIRVPGLIISPYAKHCYVDARPMSFEAITRFIENDVLGGQTLDGSTDGRPDPRPYVRETYPLAPDLSQDFVFTRTALLDSGLTPTGPTPTPLPYGATYATPTPNWCSNSW